MAVDAELSERLAAAQQGAGEHAWPHEAIVLLREAGCWGHAVPTRFAGGGVSPRDKLETYETVARGSLAAALILTQHDAACELIAEGDNLELAERTLPRLASGEWLATVGISHLTTSQRKAVAMHARPVAEGFRLDGAMPWVTSADRADVIVTGAVLGDARKILACLPQGAPGITVLPPIELLALNGTRTCEVTCADVLVDRTSLLRGPVEKALARRAPTKPLTVSTVGLGMAGALWDAVQEHADAVPEARKLLHKDVGGRYAALRERLYRAADSLGEGAPDFSAAELRAEANDLVARLALTLMTLLKGSGFVGGHPVQRLVREAHFFLVWSAPTDVQAATLRRLWAPGASE